jgi:hypothetical protein
MATAIDIATEHSFTLDFIIHHPHRPYCQDLLDHTAIILIDTERRMRSVNFLMPGCCDCQMSERESAVRQRRDPGAASPIPDLSLRQVQADKDG